MSRRIVLSLAVLLIVAACGDDDIVEIGTVVDATSTTEEPDPFDIAVGVVLNLPPDDVFVLLDSLDDGDYFALIDGAGVGGDVEFVEALDYDKAARLVEVLADELYDELLVLAQTGLDPNVVSPVGTIAPGSAPPPDSDAAADVRFVDGGPLGRKGRVFVAIGPGDISFLAFSRTGTSDAQVFVTAVFDPTGDDVGDALGLEYGELSNFGEAAFYAPINESVDLEYGEYVVAFEATADIVSSGAYVRSGDPDAPQAIDVVFWMATTERYDRTALEERFRSVGNVVLNPHGISVGTMAFIDPPADIVDRYAALRFEEEGNDEDLRSLCRQMSAAVGDVRALNFVIVDRLDGDDPDSIIEGSSAGLPGTAMLAGSDLSCVAGMASPDPDDPGRDLLERAIVVWHEAGHHLGLYHTSEADGLFFDLIDDTLECRLDEQDTNGDGFIDVSECDGLDAGNFMFYDGDGTIMTEEQAWTVRRHPLLYPVSG